VGVTFGTTSFKVVPKVPLLFTDDPNEFPHKLESAICPLKLQKKTRV
jgi:hypothetical protein